MFRRLLVSAIAGVTIVLCTATPAAAISDITNKLWTNSAGRYVSSGEKVWWQGTTVFGQWLLKNPYASDFDCLVNARHFSAPRSWHVSGTSAYWRWISYDAATHGPAWRSYSGLLWIWQPKTVYNKFYARGLRSGYVRGWRRSQLRQVSWAASKGIPCSQYTYHY